MEDVLRKIYEGSYVVEQSVEHNEEFTNANNETGIFTDKFVEELESKGIEHASTMVNDWVISYHALTREELIVMFKKGVEFGFNLVKELENN